ncbi:MAG: DUF1501 domain-containing protein [Pirellulales bacterium]
MTVQRNCAGVTRRDCLQLGLGALAGGGLVDMLRLRGQAAEGEGTAKRPTSCILVWMDGGPTHYETFDPKPDAPAEIRGIYQPIATKLPGVFFSQHMQRLASMADKLAVVRSISHNDPNHGGGNHYMMTGSPTRIPVFCGAFVSFHPSLGAVTSHERGVQNGLPAYFTMPSISRSGGPNFLGAKHAPFVVADDPNSARFRVRDVALPEGLAENRFVGRRDIRQQVDKLQRINDPAAGDPVGALDDYYQQGYSLVTSPQAQAAFDISSEQDEVRERYGRNGFGQRALLARRLVEAGVPFITLYEGGWDHHSNIFDLCDKRLPSFENTIATLIEDLDQRGLLDTTLVVALGEFGRTPKINDGAGRDHWASAMSVLFAGCGTPGGQVVGATDSKGYSASERILSPENFASTIYRKLGIDPDKILYTPQGRPTHIVSDPTPIAELMG